MSFAAMNWARSVSFGSPIRKAIAYTLADHHNGDSGRRDPGIETIAREADASVRATEINLRWMERAGAIAVLRRRGRPNCYVLDGAGAMIVKAQRPRERGYRRQKPLSERRVARIEDALAGRQIEREDAGGES